MSFSVQGVESIPAETPRRGIPGLGRLRHTLGGWSLARRFLVVYFVLLALATLGIEAWIGQQVEDGIVNRTAAVTALYIDSFIGPHVQSLASAPALDAADTSALSDVFSKTQLGRDVVSFKIWSHDGVVLYSPTAALVGQRFPIDRDLARSYDGEITADISGLSDDENAFERLHWTRLLQMYVPVRQNGSGRIIAVAEFYQLPDALDAEVTNAQLRSWSIVLVASIASFLLVGFIVRRSSDTIARQQARLQRQVAELSGLLGQVDTLNARLRRAGSQAVEITTKERRRISADLHDGPAQAMALGLLQLEAIQADGQLEADPRLAAAYGAVNDAMGELRQIAAGLRLPDLAALTVAEVASRAVDDHVRRSGAAVAAEITDVDLAVPLAVKIALFRGMQEALSNATRHGQGVDVRVRVWRDGGRIELEVRDGGPGFAADAQPPSSGLGLPGMRERAALLGGSFGVTSAPGQGTVVRMTLPIDPHLRGAPMRAEGLDA